MATARQYTLEGLTKAEYDEFLARVEANKKNEVITRKASKHIYKAKQALQEFLDNGGNIEIDVSGPKRTIMLVGQNGNCTDEFVDDIIAVRDCKFYYEGKRYAHITIDAYANDEEGEE